MKPYNSLFSKIIIWFFLSLGAVALVLFVFFNMRFRLGLESFLAGGKDDKLTMVSRLIERELNESQRSKWGGILKGFSSIYKIDFIIILGKGERIGGESITFPKSLKYSLREFGRRRPPIEQRGPGFNQRDMAREWAGRQGPPSVPPGFRLGKPPRFSHKSKNPKLYWVGMPLLVKPQFTEDNRPLFPVMLLAVSDKMTGNGLFFDPFPWIIVFAVIILLSLFLWAPMIRSITKPIGKMTVAANRIARGDFNVRLNEQRSDEIGKLSSSINEMAGRLDTLVKGQKRFLGDIAHELASPIARIQLGLEILEKRVKKNNKEKVSDVILDVTHISDLVGELLSFSRAQINPGKIELERVRIKPIVERVIKREFSDEAKINLSMDDHLKGIADPELLARAISNILRNAIRYAGDAGPVEVVGFKKEDETIIEVRDKGIGVPQEELNRLFEPFYRIDPSRESDSGGVGLGLAIVKTCVSACGGMVRARNLKPDGFAITILLISP